VSKKLPRVVTLSLNVFRVTLAVLFLNLLSQLYSIFSLTTIVDDSVPTVYHSRYDFFSYHSLLFMLILYAYVDPPKKISYQSPESEKTLEFKKSLLEAENLCAKNY